MLRQRESSAGNMRTQASAMNNWQLTASAMARLKYCQYFFFSCGAATQRGSWPSLFLRFSRSHTTMHHSW